MIRFTALLVTLLAVPGIAPAQHDGGGRSAPPTTIPPAEASQFNFLIGQWELEVRPQAQGLAARIHGVPRLSGVWKAWRAMDGWGVEDEVRIVDGSGNPSALTLFVRVFDATARRWSVTAVDAYRGRVTSATAEWRNGVMEVSGRGTDPEGRAYVSRTRFTHITPSGFRMQQDRSLDDGKTWDEAVLRIEAKRVAAAAPR